MEAWETVFWVFLIIAGTAGVCSLMALIADFCEWMADR